MVLLTKGDVGLEFLGVSGIGRFGKVLGHLLKKYLKELRRKKLFGKDSFVAFPKGSLPWVHGDIGGKGRGRMGGGIRMEGDGLGGYRDGLATLKTKVLYLGALNPFLLC